MWSIMERAYPDVAYSPFLRYPTLFSFPILSKYLHTWHCSMHLQIITMEQVWWGNRKSIIRCSVSVPEAFVIVVCSSLMKDAVPASMEHIENQTPSKRPLCTDVTYLTFKALFWLGNYYFVTVVIVWIIIDFIWFWNIRYILLKIIYYLPYGIKV